MKHLANYISLSRIALALLLLFSKPLSLEFFIIFVLCALTDVLDGYIARNYTGDSVIGAKLDSIADVTFFLSFLIVLLPILNLDYYVILWILIIFLIKAISMVIGFVKYDKLAMIHTYLNKLTGLALVLLPFLVLIFPSWNVVLAICLIASLASLEELFIVALANDLNLNSKSIIKKEKD